jgi:Leo1-like protein
MKVRLANSIRWRHAVQPDGTTKPESNTRFVRWSDGSLQVGCLCGLHILRTPEICTHPSLTSLWCGPPTNADADADARQPCCRLSISTYLQLMVGDEVLDVAETDVTGDQHFMFVRHTGFIQVRIHHVQLAWSAAGTSQ